MIVIDSSALIDALQQDHYFQQLELILEQHELIAPDHLDIECLHALRKMERLGRISEVQVLVMLEAIQKFPCVRISVRPFLKDIWNFRHNFTAYDAAYVALSIDLNTTLVTHDKRLAKAAASIVKVQRLDFSSAP